MIFSGEAHVPIALMPGMADRTFLVNSIGKTAKATGWRVGWVITPAKYTSQLRGVHDQLVVQAATPLQYGAAAMLRMPDNFFKQQPKDYTAKLDALLPPLKAAGFRIIAVPQGAYYLFVDYTGVRALKGLSPTEAAIKMTMEVGVACVPGDNFYLGASKADPMLGGRYLRFAFVRSLDLLADAAERLRSRL